MKWGELQVGCFVSCHDVVWKVTRIKNNQFFVTCVIPNSGEFWKMGMNASDRKENIHLFKKLSCEEIEELKAQNL